MMDRIERKAIIIPCLLFNAIAILMLFKEIPLLENHPHFLFYLVGRLSIIFCFFACFALSFFKFKFLFHYFPVIFYFLSLIYESHGQVFQSNYWLAYIESTTIFPFIFGLNKRLLAGLMFTGLIIFDSVFLYKARYFVGLNAFNEVLSKDILTGTIISTIISYVTAETFIKEKMKRTQIYQRFIDLGKNISFIAHDIKGMISGPCTYVDLIHSKVTAGSFSKDDLQIVDFLKEDISAVRDFVMEMNQLVSTTVTEKESLIIISEIVSSIKKVFKSKLKSIKVEVVGDIRFVTKVDYINRILINSIINSCDAINKKKKEDGRIMIYCEKNIIGIADNSGTRLSRKTLAKLNNPYITFTDKSTGSGLGVLLIRDYVNAIGGEFEYYNHLEGVSLKITLPQRIILKNTQPQEGGQLPHAIENDSST